MTALQIDPMACSLLLQLQGAFLLALRYFCDMLHLPLLYEWVFGIFMRVAVERDVVPDSILRRGIRLLLRKRLAEVRSAAIRRRLRASRPARRCDWLNGTCD